MSTDEISARIQQFSPVVRLDKGMLPRQLDLLGAPPAKDVTFITAAARALSGADAANIDVAPPVPPLAPGASFDASG